MDTTDFKWKKRKKHMVFANPRKAAGSGARCKTAEKRGKMEETGETPAKNARMGCCFEPRGKTVFLLNFQPFAVDFFRFVQYVIASMIRHSGLSPSKTVRDAVENHNPSRFMEESS